LILANKKRKEKKEVLLTTTNEERKRQQQHVLTSLHACTIDSNIDSKSFITIEKLALRDPRCSSSGMSE
jgi:hypothetical protein